MTNETLERNVTDGSTAARTRFVAGLPSPRWDAVRRQVAGVAQAVAERADELVDVLGEAVTREVRLPGCAVVLPHDGRADMCAANIRSIMAAMVAEKNFDPTPATETGIDRARKKRVLSSVMEGDRIGFRRLWDVVADEAVMHPKIDGEALRSLTAKLHTAEDLFMTAMVAGYRDEQKRQMLDDTSRRPYVIDSLLHGRILDQWSLWEAANYLRLPSTGPFVVIAAEVRTVGNEALPEIESKLRSLDVYSAWLLLPDLQVGIVHVKSDQHLDKVLALLSRVAADRIGVSARFTDLCDTPQALHFAKVTLRGRADHGFPVAVFDGSILATAAVSAPDVMVKSVGPELASFKELPDEEREILFETFRVWQDNDASVRGVAEALICHPNTVRHRLRRIEKYTGRSLSRPRDVAELCLAFEVHRRLM